jgi:hypothetical protein
MHATPIPAEYDRAAAALLLLLSRNADVTGPATPNRISDSTADIETHYLQPDRAAILDQLIKDLTWAARRLANLNANLAAAGAHQ